VNCARSDSPHRRLAASAAGAAAVSALTVDGLAAAGSSGVMAAVLEKLPADDYESARRLFDRLFSEGPKVIQRLVHLVGDEFGDPNGVKPKYALHGLVMHASRPGAASERQLVAETLAAELEAGHSDELKAFLCRQLQLCGRDEEVPALARLLTDDRLCEPATQALLAIRSDAARSALRKALTAAEGSRKITIGQAVDVLQ
jgi:hypothetical protein